LKKPDISILSDDFLAEASRLPQKNLAVELLRKLLGDEIKSRSRRNVVQLRQFSELLLNSIRKYQNRVIEAAQVIEELIALARQMREADDYGVGAGRSAFSRLGGGVAHRPRAGRALSAGGRTPFGPATACIFCIRLARFRQSIS
jgi:hypothetical protein